MSLSFITSLGAWFQNLLQRIDQLKKWSTTLETPAVLWLSGLFNPMAFLTAVMQVTARLGGFPLDNVRSCLRFFTAPVAFYIPLRVVC